MATRKGPSGGGDKHPPARLPRKPPGSPGRDITDVRIIRTPTGDFDIEELPGNRDIGDYDSELPGSRDIGDY